MWMKSVLLNLYMARCSHHVSHVRGEVFWSKEMGGDLLMKGLVEMLVLFGSFLNYLLIYFLCAGLMFLCTAFL